MRKFHRLKQESAFFQVFYNEFVGVFDENPRKFAATRIEFSVGFYQPYRRKIVSVPDDMVVFAVNGRDVNDTRAVFHRNVFGVGNEIRFLPFCRYVFKREVEKRGVDISKIDLRNINYIIGVAK